MDKNTDFGNLIALRSSTGCFYVDDGKQKTFFVKLRKENKVRKK
jgi:hypothetical protein